MSMSTHVVGIREKDEKYEQMVKALEACKAAKVKLPAEIEKYFPDSTDPVSALTVKVKTSEYHADMREGVEVDIKDLPPGIVRLRFYNSW